MTTITPTEIVNHRDWRKASGLVGCKDGSDGPLSSLRGISWRPADPMNPSCFCHDCRSTWDSDGTIDAELVNSGHDWACSVYESLLPQKRAEPSCTRQGSETYNGVTLHITPPSLSATTFEEIPISLPAPRHRDILHETFHERLHNDLEKYLFELHATLISTMDSKRSVFDDLPNRDLLIEKIMEEEEKIAKKIESVKNILAGL